METTSLPATVSSESATRKHHKFGPSRLEYLDNCAGFQNRQTESSASDEGTFLHDLMDAMIKAIRQPFQVEGEQRTYENTLDQLNDWVTANYELTEEQVTYLRFCCKRLDAIIAKGPSRILSEINVVTKNEDGTEFNHGYLDVLFIFPSNVGILIDFKFGYIPVPHAAINLQGMNYMVGIFQMFPELTKIGVKFMQPKLLSVTEAIFDRVKIYEYYSRLRRVVDQAKHVQDHPEDAQKFMRPGAYCDYCALAGTCSVLANHRATFASQFGNLPAPVPIANLTLERLEDWALARYWVDVIDKGLEDFKKRAQEVAEQNGGELRCTLPNGEEVVYEVRERSSNRVLGDAREVAEALKEFVTLDELIGAADLALTKVKPIVETSMTTLRNASLAPGEKKLTKKAAWEQATSLLEASNLLSRPDTKIKFLQLKKQQKQLTENTEVSGELTQTQQ